MKKKNFLKVILILTLIIITWFVYSKYFKKFENLPSKPVNPKTENKQETFYNSNIMKDVSYKSKDNKGNEYIITASEGEIDYSNPDIIFLKNVKSLIKLNNSKNINIISKFGKYNINNFDTIFSKSVIITYLDNKITGEYLDLSIKRNSMIISRDVIYTNMKNILKADVIEIDIETKDTKIFMLEETKKVNLKSKN